MRDPADVRPVAPDRSRPGPERIASMALLDTWSGYDWSAGLQIERLPDLDALAVRTLNSVYELVVLSGPRREMLVRGGRFFPEFTRAVLAGSSFGGSFLKVGGIYVGFRLEILASRQVIVTSPVRSIARVGCAATPH